MSTSLLEQLSLGIGAINLTFPIADGKCYKLTHSFCYFNSPIQTLCSFRNQFNECSLLLYCAEEQSDKLTSIKRPVQLNSVLSSDERTLLLQVDQTAVSSRRLAIKDVQAVVQALSGSPPSAALLRFVNALKQELKDIRLDLIAPLTTRASRRRSSASGDLRRLAEDKRSPSFGPTPRTRRSAAKWRW
jgi:hypothetical protein